MLTNSADIIRRLKHEGFVLKSIRGSHHKFVHEATKRMAIVVHPKRDIPIGTARDIYRAAGWERD
ncbi:MAG: hypothetical protein DCF30_14295 [Hyphomicrobiales bacterium]|nr:MAG: hypothetical protein DCF30_14295 [Hyphomicrobiales bacterium]